MLQWYLQMIISAFYSAIRGGMLFAEGLFDALNDRGLIKYLPCVPLPYDPDLTFVDEAVSFTAVITRRSHGGHTAVITRRSHGGHTRRAHGLAFVDEAVGTTSAV